MELKELLNKYKNKVLNLAVILLALIVAGNIHKQQAASFASLKEKKDSEIKKSAVLENIGKLEKRMGAYKSFLAKKDINSVINTITGFAKESGIKISAVKPAMEREQRHPQYTRLPISITINAPSYNGVGKFVAKLENCKDIYVVEDLKIKSKIQAKDLDKELDVDLTISSIEFVN